MASGSGAAIAAGSLLTTMTKGMEWRQAAALPVEALTERLGRPESASLSKGINISAAFAIEALHRAFEDAFRREKFPVASGAGKKTVLVAMSGGVDSSVACLLEQRAGRDVIGLTMRLLDDPGGNDGDDAGRSCCSAGAVLDARETCHSLGLPHLTIDYSRPFFEEVINDFCRSYLAGMTPNPCVRCNGRLRFPALVRLAARLGAAKVATGHYVRIVRRKGAPLLARGVDRDKDQSYMLWAVKPGLLEKLSFPLGEMSKPAVRLLAQSARLQAGGRPESQDICFIPGGDYRSFITSSLGERQAPGPGDIVDLSGGKIGVHDGYHNYTVGQRRGLGGGGRREAMYVIKTLPEKNLVVAGPRKHLAVRSIKVSGINSFAGVEAKERLLLQMRYNSPAVEAQVRTGNGKWEADLSVPAYGIAPGQSAVFYRGSTLAAGGIITATNP